MRVDHLQTALLQSPVKSQGRRGTCSIFSATAILEYNLEKMGLTAEDPDLSEQWLEYITAGQRGSEGSWSDYNFNRYGRYGYVLEDQWAYNPMSWHPYDPEYWESFASEEEKAHFDSLCGETLETSYLNHCLIGQRDPRLLSMNSEELSDRDQDFLVLRGAAKNNLVTNALNIRSRWVSSVSNIQSSLDRGEVLALDVTFFYEAWNHRKALSLGLVRDSELWAQGVVSYPDRNSLDYQKSRESENRAGHSIVLVGYDKDVVIEREVMDQDGQLMTVRTQGVYYFKNSWGQDSFGVDFELQGEILSGFGMISMDYAHEHGSFYEMIISQSQD